MGFRSAQGQGALFQSRRLEHSGIGRFDWSARHWVGARRGRREDRPTSGTGGQSSRVDLDCRAVRRTRGGPPPCRRPRSPAGSPDVHGCWNAESPECGGSARCSRWCAGRRSGRLACPGATGCVPPAPPGSGTSRGPCHAPRWANPVTGIDLPSARRRPGRSGGGGQAGSLDLQGPAPRRRPAAVLLPVVGQHPVDRADCAGERAMAPGDLEHAHCQAIAPPPAPSSGPPGDGRSFRARAFTTRRSARRPGSRSTAGPAPG